MWVLRNKGQLGQVDLETKPFVKTLSVDLVNSSSNISLDEKLVTEARWFNGKSFSLPTQVTLKTGKVCNFFLFTLHNGPLNVILPV